MLPARGLRVPAMGARAAQLLMFRVRRGSADRAVSSRGDLPPSRGAMGHVAAQPPRGRRLRSKRSWRASHRRGVHAKSELGPGEAPCRPLGDPPRASGSPARISSARRGLYRGRACVHHRPGIASPQRQPACRLLDLAHRHAKSGREPVEVDLRELGRVDRGLVDVGRRGEEFGDGVHGSSCRVADARGRGRTEAHGTGSHAPYAGMTRIRFQGTLSPDIIRPDPCVSTPSIALAQRDPVDAESSLRTIRRPPREAPTRARRSARGARRAPPGRPGFGYARRHCGHGHARFHGDAP